jgi:tetratricopeptide (TPR) repeat protein
MVLIGRAAAPATMLILAFGLPFVSDFSRQVYRAMYALCTLTLMAALVSTRTPLLAAQDGTSKAESFESLLRRGFAFHRDQQYAHSIPLLEQARTLRPHDYQVNLLLGIDYLRSGQPAKSLIFLGSARQANTQDSIVLGYLAEAYSFLEQFDKAVEALHLTTSNSEASSQTNLSLVHFYLHRFHALAQELRSSRLGLAYAYRLQALTLQARSDPGEREALLQVQVLYPEFPGLDTAFGHFELAQGSFEQARISFAKARVSFPDDLNLYWGEAVLAIHFGDRLEGEGLLAKIGDHSRQRLLIALKEWPASVPLPPETWGRVVKEPGPNDGVLISASPSDLFREQRWEKLVQMLASKASSPEEWRWLGIALAQLEQFEKAIPPLERARKEDQWKLECDYWLSLCYAREVEHLIRRLPRTGPEATLAHLAKGEILLRLALSGTAAAEEYRKAAAIAPGDPAVWTGLAEAQLLAGASEESRQSAQKARELDPHRIEAARVFAEASIRQRDYSAAIPALQQVLAAQPKDLHSQVLIGTAYSKTGEDKQAAQCLEKALSEGYPDEKGTTHYLLGTVLQRLGRASQAEKVFEQAQALSDSFAQSAHRLRESEQEK